MLGIGRCLQGGWKSWGQKTKTVAKKIKIFLLTITPPPPPLRPPPPPLLPPPQHPEGPQRVPGKSTMTDFLLILTRLYCINVIVVCLINPQCLVIIYFSPECVLSLLPAHLILVVGGLGVSGLLARTLPEPLGQLGWREEISLGIYYSKV